jgi:hypothetical protein
MGTNSRRSRQVSASMAVAFVVACAGGAAGCFSSSSAGPAPESPEDASESPDAAAREGAAAAVADATLDVHPDSAADATLESGPDATSPESGVPGSDAGESGIADTSLAAEAAADATSPVDASEAGAADASEAGAAVSGYALQFNDSTQPQYVAIPDTDLLNFVTDFSMEAWVNVTGAGQQSTTSIIGKPFGGGQTDTTAVWLSGGSLYAAVNLGGTSGAAGCTWSAANGAWHHVAWTYVDATALETLYIDGVQCGQATSTAGFLLYDGHPMVFGADIDNGAYTFGFYGAIDDVRVFSSARTLGQIADDMALVSPLGDPTLVAYYPFDEGSGNVAHDLSPNHLDGLLGGALDASASAPTWISATLPAVVAPADAGPSTGPDASNYPALEFNPGDPDYVAVADSTSLDVTAALTYEAWIDVDADVSGILTIFGKAYGSAAADTIGVWFQAGALYGSVNGDSTSGAASYTWSYPNGDWHHVAFTYDGTSQAQSLYVDGSLAGTATNTLGTPAYDAHPLLIGSDIDYGSYEYGFGGIVADVRIFSAARSASQIQTDMTGASPLGDPTLVAYYPLDEGAGSAAPDHSPNGLNGALGEIDAGTNAPTWVVLGSPF